MNARHTYADVIIAWAEGKPIQFKTITEKYLWEDFTGAPLHTPGFNNPNLEWRIKPNIIKFRIFLTKNAIGNLVVSSTTPDYYVAVNRDLGFIRWIGEEQEKLGINPICAICCPHIEQFSSKWE